jgi:hypothetical protein
MSSKIHDYTARLGFVLFVGHTELAARLGERRGDPEAHYSRAAVNDAHRALAEQLVQTAAETTDPERLLYAAQEHANKLSEIPELEVE